MTFFYLKLLEVKVARAKIKHREEVESFLFAKRQDAEVYQYMPCIVSEFSHIMDSFQIIRPIGRLVIQGLLSDQTQLVFPWYKLESMIGKVYFRTGIEHRHFK